MKLIVGLGNPGKDYENTRHNIGFMVIDNYLKDINWKQEETALTYKQNDVLFIKPTTFMNLSGGAVRHYVDYYKIDIKDILIIHDDMDIPLGTLRLKYNSSSGGHNGIKDIINKLNQNNLLRLKIGISKPTGDVIDYVLHKFSKTELESLNQILELSVNIIDDFIKDVNKDDLMNHYN